MVLTQLARITSHENQQLTLALAARQRIPVTANGKEKKNTVIFRIRVNDCTPDHHRNIVT